MNSLTPEEEDVAELIHYCNRMITTEDVVIIQVLREPILLRQACLVLQDILPGDHLHPKGGWEMMPLLTDLCTLLVEGRVIWGNFKECGLKVCNKGEEEHVSAAEVLQVESHLLFLVRDNHRADIVILYQALVLVVLIVLFSGEEGHTFPTKQGLASINLLVLCAGSLDFVPTAPGAVVLGLPITLLSMVEEPVDSSYEVEVASIFPLGGPTKRRCMGRVFSKG